MRATSPPLSPSTQVILDAFYLTKSSNRFLPFPQPLRAFSHHPLTTIQQLSLIRTLMTWNELLLVSDALFTRLAVLDFGHNQIGDGASLTVSAHLPFLTELNLDFNSLESIDSFRHLVK